MSYFDLDMERVLPGDYLVLDLKEVAYFYQVSFAATLELKARWGIGVLEQYTKTDVIDTIIELGKLGDKQELINYYNDILYNKKIQDLQRCNYKMNHFLYILEQEGSIPLEGSLANPRL